MPPMHLALCIVSAATDIYGALALGPRGAPAEPAVLWMVTSSGHMLARAPAAALAPPPPPRGGGGAEAARAAAEAAGLGPLSHIASGFPFGVGSTLTLALDGATGDVGLTVRNPEAGSGAGEAGEGDGAAVGPPPFDLLPPELLDAPLAHEPITPPLGAERMPVRVFHGHGSGSGSVSGSDGSGGGGGGGGSGGSGGGARVHAIVCRMPLATVSTGARALQVCVLCRGPAGMMLTVVP